MHHINCLNWLTIPYILLANVSKINKLPYPHLYVISELPPSNFPPATDTVTGYVRGCAREQACLKLESMWTRKYGFVN